LSVSLTYRSRCKLIGDKYSDAQLIAFGAIYWRCWCPVTSAHTYTI